MGDVEGSQSVCYREDSQEKELVAQVHTKLQTFLRKTGTTQCQALVAGIIRVCATLLMSHLPCSVVDDGVEEREDRYLQVGRILRLV